MSKAVLAKAPFGAPARLAGLGVFLIMLMASAAALAVVAVATPFVLIIDAFLRRMAKTDAGASWRGRQFHHYARS